MPVVWVIDTSSITEVRRPALQILQSEHARVFRALGELVESGALVFPKQVREELERQHPTLAARGHADLPYEWAKRHAERAMRHGTDYEALREVLEVEGVAELLDPDKPGVEDADPYVLALARRLARDGDSARVVTEDRRNAPDKLSLASACGLVGIPVVPMKAFLRHHRVWPRS